MPLEFTAVYLKAPVFALVACRLAGLLMFQPLLGALSVPARLRAILVIALAAVLSPMIDLPAGSPDTPLGLALAMAAEVALGGLLGVFLNVIFLGMQLGGLLVAQEAGLAYGQMIDPSSGEDTTVVSGFYLQLAAVLYLIVGGHRALVAAALDTFDAMPLLALPARLDEGVGVLLDGLRLSGHVAATIAAPAVITLFLVNTAMGFISRTVPQLNVISVGFALKSMLAFMLMAVSLPAALTGFMTAVDFAVSHLPRLIPH